jgi:hypothetical protein
LVAVEQQPVELAVLTDQIVLLELLQHTVEVAADIIISAREKTAQAAAAEIQQDQTQAIYILQQQEAAAVLYMVVKDFPAVALPV